MGRKQKELCSDDETERQKDREREEVRKRGADSDRFMNNPKFTF